MPFQEEPRLGVANRKAPARWLPAEYEDGPAVPFAGRRGRRARLPASWLVSAAREGRPPELARGHAARGKGGAPLSTRRREDGDTSARRQTCWQNHTRGDTAMGTRPQRFRKTPLEGCRSRVPSPATWWARPSRHQAKYPGVSRADGLPAPSLRCHPTAAPGVHQLLFAWRSIYWPHLSWQASQSPSVPCFQTPGTSWHFLKWTALSFFLLSGRHWPETIGLQGRLPFVVADVGELLTLLGLRMGVMPPTSELVLKRKCTCYVMGTQYTVFNLNLQKKTFLPSPSVSIL